MDKNIQELHYFIEAEAHRIADSMYPAEKGKLLYPDSDPVPLKKVPQEIVADHLTRYSKQELKRGQFMKVGSKYTFIMNKKAYDKRNNKTQLPV